MMPCYGDSALIADMVSTRDKNHGVVPGQLILKTEGVVKNITIGRNCWLDSKVTLTAGASLGDNVVVGVNAVHTRQFADNLVLGCASRCHPKDRRRKGALNAGS
jgi:acetyltransferase-like isoleucine patch superfamily enzyme